MIDTQRRPDTDTSARLRLVDEGDTVLPEGAVDARGMKVHDQSGAPIGRVDGMLFDPTEGRVRFIRITSGGFMGLGASHFFVPMDALAAAEPGRIMLARPFEEIRQAPTYMPDLADERAWIEATNRHFGYPPV
jgi:hypothetical protein